MVSDRHIVRFERTFANGLGFSLDSAYNRTCLQLQFAHTDMLTRFPSVANRERVGGHRSVAFVLLTALGAGVWVGTATASSLTLPSFLSCFLDHHGILVGVITTCVTDGPHGSSAEGTAEAEDGGNWSHRTQRGALALYILMDVAAEARP